MKTKTSVDLKWLPIFGIVAFLLIFQAFPLLYLVYSAFVSKGHISLNSLQRLYTYPLNLHCLKNTLISATLAMIFGVIIALPLAWLVGRTNLYAKKFFRTLFVSTYMVPPYVGAMAWLRLLNPTVGTLNSFLKNVLNLSDMPFNIYSMGGLVFVLTTFYYPYAFITISRAMENMDPSLEEAARMSGASPVRTLFTVTLPLMIPSIVASALLVFVAAASCYGIPSIIGAPGRLYTVTTRIVDYVYIGSQAGLEDAVSLAFVLMILVFVILYISYYAIGKKNHITISGKAVKPSEVDLGRWRVPVTIAVALFALIIIVIPFVTVFATSFTLNMGRSVLSAGNFTVKYWKIITSRHSITGSVTNSMVAAFCAATIGMIICLVMAYIQKRTTIKGRYLPDFLITVGSGTPSVVIALALIMTMSGRFGINIYNTLAIMVIAYMIKYMMMGMRTVVSALSQVSADIEEAAQSSGAGWFRRLKDVLFPLVAPSAVAGWFLIFIPSFYELTMSNLLYSDKTRTLGVELFINQTYNSQQTASALAGSILLAVVIFDLLLYKLTKGKFSI